MSNRKSTLPDQALSAMLAAYIPADRRAALAQQRPLPPRLNGAALFADISGFTPLTEALTQTLGPRHGAEELTRQLNRVYDALITIVDRYGGSVIGFAGDAITCWFTDQAAQTDSAALRAVACALGMQAVMSQVATVSLPSGASIRLAMKTAVATGPAYRLLVGNPDIQLLDALAGQTVVNMASAEHQANKGEVIIDAVTAQQLDTQLTITEWRIPETGAGRFAVVGSLTRQPQPTPFATDLTQLSADQLRLSLLPAVYDRLTEGLGDFLTELRPVVALFVRFGGIDYDSDPDAHAKLDAYIRWAQQVLDRYGGIFSQLIIGDKGSYFLAAFGAPVAHEDDTQRAVTAAWDLRQLPPDLDYIIPVQIGISQGTVRTGAYGGTTRRTYSVIGDEVNLAARLMQNAAPGEILASLMVQKATNHTFEWEMLPPLRVKGKQQPVPIARLTQKKEATTAPLTFSGTLVGREKEIGQLNEWLLQLWTPPDEVANGRFAGVMTILGEAGVGKSRLVYELRRRIQRQHSVSWFICPAEQILRQSLNPFKHFLREYFEQAAGRDDAINKIQFEFILDDLQNYLRLRGQRQLETELQRTRSFLGALVDLHWADSLYEQLEPKLRFENSLTALKVFIQAESLRRPVILQIEDAHWLDADSLALLHTLTRQMNDYPVAIMLTARYQDDGAGLALGLDEAVPQQEMNLNNLTPAGIQAIARQILGDTISESFATFLQTKTGGNPFFVEQLVFDLRERAILQRTSANGRPAQWSITAASLPEVPATINAVIIARLDRLTARVKAVVQTAAVIGQEFEVAVLGRMLRSSEGLPGQIKQAENEAIWSALTEMRYIFKHTLLRDAAYDMQVRTHLRNLHAIAGQAIADLYAAELGPHYADLAYHFEQASDMAHTLHYAHKAGDRAVEQFANEEAVEHYRHALQAAEQLAAEETAVVRQKIHAALGKLLTNTGRYDAAHPHLIQAHQIAAAANNPEAGAYACRLIARLHEKQGDYEQSMEWVTQGLTVLDGKETREAAQLRLITGLIFSRQGELEQARMACEDALRIAQNSGEMAVLARAHNLLGHLRRQQGDSQAAIIYYQRSLDLYRQTGNIEGEATTYNLIAVAYLYLGQLPEAEQGFRQARQMFDQIGNVYHRAFADNNLGEILLKRGDLTEALRFYQTALSALKEIGGSAYVLGALHNNLSTVYIRRDEPATAAHHLAASQKYFVQTNARDFLPEMHRHMAEVALLQDDLAAAKAQGQEANQLAQELGLRGEEGCSLRVLGQLAWRQEETETAVALLQESITMLEEVGDEYEAARSQLALAQILYAQNQPDAAQDVLQQCRPVFAQLEAMLDLEAAQALQNKIDAYKMTG